MKRARCQNSDHAKSMAYERAAMLLIFSLGLRLPLYLRGRLARVANPGIVIAALGLALLGNVALYRHDAHFDATPRPVMGFASLNPSYHIAGSA